MFSSALNSIGVITVILPARASYAPKRAGQVPRPISCENPFASGGKKLGQVNPNRRDRRLDAPQAGPGILGESSHGEIPRQATELSNGKLLARTRTTPPRQALAGLAVNQRRRR